MTPTERIMKMEDAIDELQMIRRLQHETLEVQLESIKLLAQRLIKLEEQATERGWILRDEPHRTM